MIMSELGFQQIIGQVEKINTTCRLALRRHQSPAVARDIRAIAEQANDIKAILVGDVQPDPPTPKASKREKETPRLEGVTSGPQDPAA